MKIFNGNYKNKNQVWLYAIVTACFIASYTILYSEGFRWLFSQWSTDESYSHGFLVPIISLYIAWMQRERFRQLPIAPLYVPATIIIFFCLALLFASRCGAIIQLEALSLFLIIPGILLLLFGWHVTRAALLPWLYLSFMIPWIDVFLDRLYYPFQLISAVLGTTLLEFFYPVHRSEIYIHLPSISMVVVEGCSGLSFLMSVLGIGIPLVYLTQRTWTRGILILIVGVLITILANGLRVALAGFMGQHYGVDLLHGPAHILQGWLVAWIGWIALFLVNWLVGRRTDTNLPYLCERWRTLDTPSSAVMSADGSSPRKLLAVTALLLLCAGLVHLGTPHPSQRPAPLADLPQATADWTGSNTIWLHEKPLFPGATDQLNRVYTSPHSQSPVYLHISFFDQQTEQRRLVSMHSSALHKGPKKVQITDTSLRAKLPLFVNKSTLKQGNTTYDLLFWYQFPNGEVQLSRNQARLTALRNGILSRNNSGSIIIIATPQQTSGENDKQDSIPQPIASFLKTFSDHITKQLP